MASESTTTINWLDKYLPGTTDNFVSNEIVVQGLSVNDTWPLLVDTSKWEAYYDNVADINFPSNNGPMLQPNVDFKFSTFGFPPLDAHVVEFKGPSSGQPARLSWTAKQGGDFTVMHGWVLEDLALGRVRILTQESQIGEPAKKLAKQVPNPMLNGHQAWLIGLRDAAFKRKQ
ncbi:hypothetical protein BJV82DRAFT_644599 [Fennellomyces sp. T-0311]|nr:hypothetical protein BJV82DRAFT_644599 [Fennellomyces sp. T-0311]